MLDLFTDRAKKVMYLAREEADFSGHAKIGTEDVLLGLVKGSGVANHILNEFEVNEKKIREEMLKIQSPATVVIEIPNPAPIGGSISEDVLTLKSKAEKQMLSLSHTSIGTEHLLLALIEPEAGVPYQTMGYLILQNLGIDLVKMREGIINLICPQESFTFTVRDLDMPKRFLVDFKQDLGILLPKKFKDMGIDTIITVTVKKKAPVVPTAPA